MANYKNDFELISAVSTEQKAALEKVYSDVNDLKVTIDNINKEISSTSIDENIKASINTSLEPINAKLDAYDTSIAAVNANMASLSEAIEALKTALTAYPTVEQVNAAIASSSASIQVEIDDVNSYQMKLREAIEALKTALTAYPTVGQVNEAIASSSASIQVGIGTISADIKSLKEAMPTDARTRAYISEQLKASATSTSPVR